MGGTGLEQSADSTGNTAILESSAAKSGAFSPDFAPNDPGLAEVLAAWPTLPGDTKAGILAIIRAAGE